MSWDITTDLGSTALAVAAQRAAETAQDDPLIHDGLAAVLVAAANEPGWQRIACGDLSSMGAEVYHHSTMHFGDERLSAWRDGAAEIDEALGVDVDVTAFIKNHDGSDTASWLSQHGWMVDSLDSREKMSRLGRPIPPDLRDIAPTSSLVTAIRSGP